MMYNINLNDKAKELKEDGRVGTIEFNKQMSRHTHECREKAKLSKCFYCGEQVTSFCNSHSIPAFCLKNIATNGKVMHSNSILDLPLGIKKESGVQNAGTFHLLCNDCDSKIFQSYENPNAYNILPSSKLLAEIALKCCLKSISKRSIETEMYNSIIEATLDEDLCQDAINTNSINKLDLMDFQRDFYKAKRLSKKDEKDGYYLIYYDLLEYVVPLAFQGQIALCCDFEKKIINEIYNTNPKYEIKDLYLCVFPLKTKTAILMFIDNNEKRYRSFYKKFVKLEREEKLSVINYLIFAYSEDFFFSEKIKENITPKLKEIIGQTTNMLAFIDEMKDHNEYSTLANNFDLNEHNNIPNFLSETYKM